MVRAQVAQVVSFKKTFKMENIVGIIVIVMFIGFGIINYLYSKKDRRFKNAFKPNTLSIKGWIISILWLAVMLGLLMLTS